MTALEVPVGVAVLGLSGAALVLATREDDAVDGEAIARSVDAAIADLELDRTAGELETHAREMQAFHRAFEQLRAEFDRIERPSPETVEEDGG